MSGEDGPPVDGDNLEAPLDDSLVLILEGYLAGLEEGRPADVEKLLAQHPALAGRLRACLAAIQMAHGVADDSGSAAASLRRIQRLDATAAFSSRSALTKLRLGPDALPQVHLRDLADEPEPLVKPRLDAVPTLLEGGFARFQLQGEIARGGMGAVFKGRDVDLGRDLAIKVLLESHQRNPEVVRRFVEEAQIGGQLQHPGIVPVYELGTFPDRRPFFAMKLVKGRTLSALLSERMKDERGRTSARMKDEGGRLKEENAAADESVSSFISHPSSFHSDLPRFLSIFEQVCQTMAYAHARGVIHRDLKPSNVMVGSFGEVQVMDWGLAKVLPQGGIADEARVQPAVETVIMTVRSGSAGSGSESQAGSVLGTPSYMAPEQARGEIERIDERSDVFGLGAILCEILTGQPPFVASSREETRAQAAWGDLADAIGRLESCGVDAELISLARSCLRPEWNRRPRNAGEVARRISGYVAEVQQRLKVAELARVEAQARAEEETKRRAVADELAREARARADEERKRRRITAALAASLLALTAVGGLAAMYVLQQQRARTARVERLLARAAFYRDEARSRPEDTRAWENARDALDQVEASPEVSVRREAILAEIQAGLADARRLVTLRSALFDIRGAQQDAGLEATDSAYSDAFRSAGIDLATLAESDAAALIRRHSPAIVIELATALDHWSEVRRQRRLPAEAWGRPLEVARLADADLYRGRLRRLIADADLTSRLPDLQALAAAPQAADLSAATALVLVIALERAGNSSAALAALRRAVARHPGDVWLNGSLALALAKLRPQRREEALGYFRTVRSLKPELAHDLAHHLEGMGLRDEAEAVFRELIRRRPDDPRHRGCYGKLLQECGRGDEAKPMLDQAVAGGRETTRRRPNDADSHTNLGGALLARGSLEDAAAEFREAIRLKPGSATAHRLLGDALQRQGKLQEALSNCRAAIRFDSDDGKNHNAVGIVLLGEGKLKEAESEFRQAIRLEPDLAMAHNGLGAVLFRQGNLEGAVAEAREAIRLQPDYAETYKNLGSALLHQGKLEDSVREFQKAIALKPNLLEAHCCVGMALREQGKLDEAVAAHRQAIRLNPGHAEAHKNLGYALAEQGNFQDAVAECREAIRLDPESGDSHNIFGIVRQLEGKLDEAVAQYRAAIRFSGNQAKARANLGAALCVQGKLDEAVAELREAIRLEPNDAQGHDNLGTALAELRMPEEAVAEYRAAIRLKPNDPRSHDNLGATLAQQGKLDEAIAEHREAIRLKPDYAEAHCNLGHALRAQGRFAEALTELKRGHELGSRASTWRHPSAQWVWEAERLVELNNKLPAILSGMAKPNDCGETLGFALLCYEKKLHGASAKFWSDGFQAQPKLADEMQVQHRYNAACAAALAGCVQGKDYPPLDEPTKARWRKQAIDWLRADLAAWSKILKEGPPQAPQSMPETLQHWKTDPDLTGLRDPEAVKRLPEAEQSACRALWAEVDALLTKARAGTASRPQK
jgi:serine/threonine-protein kinase